MQSYVGDRWRRRGTTGGEGGGSRRSGGVGLDEESEESARSVGTKEVCACRENLMDVFEK
jgi:hypothetical protein